MFVMYSLPVVYLLLSIGLTIAVAMLLKILAVYFDSSLKMETSKVKFIFIVFTFTTCLTLVMLSVPEKWQINQTLFDLVFNSLSIVWEELPIGLLVWYHYVSSTVESRDD